MATAYEVVKKFPNLQFILDHCGLPFEKDDAAKKLWKQGITIHRKCNKRVRHTNLNVHNFLNF